MRCAAQNSTTVNANGDACAANDIEFLAVQFHGRDDADVGQPGLQAIGAFGGDTSPVPTAEELRELRMLAGALGDRAPELGTALQTLERLAAQQPLIDRSHVT